MRPFRSCVGVCFASWLALCAAACSSPTSPALPPQFARLAVTCSASGILAGEIVVCRAAIGPANVGLHPAAVWTSSDPSVARPEGFGLFTGRSTGQVTLTVSYSGESVSAPLTVDLQDMVNVGAAAYGGSFRVGTTANLWLQGGYGVASANSGTLTLVVTDQTGAIIHTSAPLVLPHGGDRYIISTTLRLPPGASRVCRKAVLRIGSTKVTAVPVAGLVPCFDVSA